MFSRPLPHAAETLKTAKTWIFRPSSPPRAKSFTPSDAIALGRASSVARTAPSRRRRSRATANTEKKLNFTSLFGNISVDETGFTLAQVAARAGWALDTKLQCVADGAEWIQPQWRGNLGTQARFLLDLYHLCEHLAAAKSAHTHGRWLEVQKARLKRNRHDLVFKSLRAFADAPGFPEEETPVRAAIRYLSNHAHCLDYARALADELPLGSGFIESGHRHILQKRLKIAGAWWLRDNALSMAHLRVLRANEAEDAYRQSIWHKTAS